MGKANTSEVGWTPTENERDHMPCLITMDTSCIQGLLRGDRSGSGSGNKKGRRKIRSASLVTLACSLLLRCLGWFFCRFLGISLFRFFHLLFLLRILFCLVCIGRLLLCFRVRANCVGFLAASAALAGLLFGAAGTGLCSSTRGSSCRGDGYAGQKTRNAQTGEDSLHLLAVHDVLLSRKIDPPKTG